METQTPTETADYTQPSLHDDLLAVARERCTWCRHEAYDAYPGERGEWRRCRQCGFWRSTNLVDPHAYADEDYDLEYQHSYYGRSIRRKRRTSRWRFKVIEAIHPGPGDFLDIGCSYGTMIEAANARGWRGHGTDIAPAIVDWAREHGLDVTVGDLTNIAFPDASMDVVHARHVLEHDIQTDRALLEIWRVLKPGGLLVIEVPDGECLRARLNPRRECLKWQYLHMVTFTPPVLRGFCQRVGLVEVPEPLFIPGDPLFLGWRHHRQFREKTRIATYFVTWWRKPA